MTQWMISPKFNTEVHNMVHDSAAPNMTVAEQLAK